MLPDRRREKSKPQVRAHRKANDAREVRKIDFVRTPSLFKFLMVTFILAIRDKDSLYLWFCTVPMTLSLHAPPLAVRPFPYRRSGGSSSTRS